MHEHSSKCAVGLSMIVDASMVSETLALRRESCLVQERTKIKRHSGLNQTQCVIRGRQRRCFDIWLTLCLMDNNIIASSLIVAYRHVSPPFGGLFLSFSCHNGPEDCEKPFVIAFTSFAKEAARLFRLIISSAEEQASSRFSPCPLISLH